MNEADGSRRGPMNPPDVTQAAVAELLARGNSIASIAEELGIVKSTVCSTLGVLGSLGTNVRAAPTRTDQLTWLRLPLLRT